MFRKLLYFRALLAFATGFTFLVAATFSSAETRPVHVYNGVGRPFVINVDRPAKYSELELKLLEPVSGKVIEKGFVLPGKVDVAKALPGLWTRKVKQVLYLQLYQDGSPTGPAIVLQPMTNPSVATLDSEGKTVKFSMVLNQCVIPKNLLCYLQK